MNIEDVKKIDGWEDYMEAMNKNYIPMLPEIGTEVQIGSPENKAVITGVFVLNNESGLGVSFKQGDQEASMPIDKICEAIKTGVITW